MNYEKVYNDLIKNRQENPAEEGIYTERHHIVPRCLGGTDDKSNLVDLPAREHFIAHYLLWKMASKGTDIVVYKKLSLAFSNMKAGSTKGKRYFNNRLYHAAAQEKSRIMSELQSGKLNSQYNTKWIFTFDPEDITKKVEKKIPKDMDIPLGWFPGRKLTKVIHCKNEMCFEVLIKPVKKKKYCSDSCRKEGAKKPYVYEHEEKFIEVFKETGSLNKACKAIGIFYGSQGSHAVTGRRLVEERGLLSYMDFRKI